MDGLQEIAPRTREFTFQGRRVRLGQLRLRHYAAIEAEVLARKPTPLAVVAPTVKDMPFEQAQYLLGLAYDDSIKVRRASPSEIDDFLVTQAGVAFMLWLALRDDQPDITRAQVEDYVFGLDHAAIESLQEELNQLEPPRGNADGRPNQPAQTNGVAHLPGGVSSAN